MKKRLIALALSAIMLMALVAGCSGTAEPAESTAPEAVSQQPEEVAAPAEETEEAQEPAEEAAEEPAQEEEETPAVDSSTLYPIFEGDTHIFTVMGSASSQFIGFIDETTFVKDNFAMTALEEATGCNIEFFMMCTDDVYQEKFNLVCASNDYPDMMLKATGNYTGGADALVEDEVCIDMTPYLDEYAPELAALFRDDKDYADAVLSKEGRVVGVNMRAWPTTSGGNIIRKDWLDELGLDVPETFDQVHEVLLAFKNEYGCTNAVCIDSKLGSGLSIGYNITFNAENVGWAVEDGQVVCSLEQQGSKDYVEMLATFYDEGLFSDDFLTFINPQMFETQALNHNTGLWNSGRMTFNGQFESKVTDDDNFEVMAIKDISRTGNEITSVGGFDSVAGKNCVSISTGCEYPEEAVTFINYLFTEEGMQLANFGVQGKTYELDENGDPYYLDIIVNNPDYPNSNVTRNLFTANAFLPYMQTQEAMEMTFTDPRMGEAESIWASLRSSAEYSWSLDTDANAEYSLIATDLNTYAQEQLYAFVIGDRDMSEWDAFIDELYGMRLDEMQAIQQAAFEEKYN